ncbi:MAG: hypothetical protein DCC65_02135 [Planctomycetota bacterium]|nr:MAG: hypothetical protein DCC65_02135 [Planctomycetota bacterium]
MKPNPLQRVIERACADAAYRSELIADPRRVLADAGIDVPRDVDVRIHESREDRLTIVLPARGESSLAESRCRLPVGPVSDVPEGLSLEWQESLNLPKRTLVVRGRVDAATAPAMRREIERAFVNVDLDLSGVTYISSAGLGALVAAQQGLRGRDCKLCLRLVPSKVRNMLEVAGMLPHFEVHDIDEYREGFPKGSATLFGGVAPTKPITDVP